MKIKWMLIGLTWLMTTVACSLSGSTAEPAAAIAPITVGNNLAQVDVCRAIPQESIAAVMGRKLVSAPEPFSYDNTAESSGCAYDAGKDSGGNAVFGYVAFTPASVYAAQPLYKNVAVPGIGQSAYFNNGADARQLWVKVNDRVAFVVAFGDKPNEEGAKKIARMVAAAIVQK